MNDTTKRIAWSFGQGFVAGATVAAAAASQVDCSSTLHTGLVFLGGVVAGGVTGGLAAVKNTVFAEGSRFR